MEKRWNIRVATSKEAAFFDAGLSGRQSASGTESHLRWKDGSVADDRTGWIFAAIHQPGARGRRGYGLLANLGGGKPRVVFDEIAFWRARVWNDAGADTQVSAERRAMGAGGSRGGVSVA